MPTPEQLRARSRRIESLYTSDPLLSPAYYGDIENGFRQGVPYFASYAGLSDHVYGLDPNSDLDAIARAYTTNIPTGGPADGLATVTQEPEEGQRGFWTKFNDFAGALLGGEGFGAAMDAWEGDTSAIEERRKQELAITRQLAANDATGRWDGRLRKMEQQEEDGYPKLSDYARQFFEFPGHIYRATVEYEIRRRQELDLDPDGKEDLKTLLDFSPASWAAAWRATEKGEEYYRAEPPSDLPQLQREIAKKFLSGQSEFDIARDLGGEWDDQIVHTVLEAPETKQYIEDLRGQQVSMGRDIVELNAFGREGAGLEPGTAPHNIVSGALDFIWQVASPGPDKGVMSGLRAARSSGRYFLLAAKESGNLERVLHSRPINRVLRNVADNPSPSRILEEIQLPGNRRIPTELARAWGEVEPGDIDTAREVLYLAASGGGKAFDTRIPQVLDIPRVKFTGRIGNTLIKWETADPIRRKAANIWNRMRTTASEVPRSTDLADRSEAYNFMSSLIDTFPRVFGPTKRRELLDEVLAAESSATRWEVGRKIWHEAIDHPRLKLKPQTRKVARNLYDKYHNLRAYMIDPDTGDELSVAMREVAGKMMERGVPHLGPQFSAHLPIPPIDDMVRLRWSQGSFTQAFTRFPFLGNSLLALTRFQQKVWVPLVLVTRPAWTMRVIGDEMLRISALGKGPLSNPGEWLREVQSGIRSAGGSGLSSLVPVPKRLRHRQSNYSFIPATSELGDDIPGAVTVSKSRIVAGDTRKTSLTPGRAKLQATVPTEEDPWGIHGWQNSLRELLDDKAARELIGSSTARDGATIEDVARKIAEDPAWSSYRERILPKIEELGGEREYVAHTAAGIAGLIRTNAPLENLMAQIARGDVPRIRLTSKQGRGFLAQQEDVPQWVKRPIGWADGEEGLWSQWINVGYDYMMDRPSTFLDRLPFFRQNRQEAIETGSAFARREGRLLDDADLIRNYRARWEEQTQETIDMLRTKADEIARGQEHVSVAELEVMSPGLATGNRERVTALRKSADVLEQRLGRLDSAGNRVGGTGPRAVELDALALDDGFTTMRVIEDSAKSYAAGRVIDILYDPTRRTWYQAQLRTAAPFLAAWWEFFETWTRIIGENPMVAAYAGRVGAPALQPNEGGEGPKVAAPLDYAVRLLTGSGVEFESPLDSFNLFTDNPYPGTGPVVQSFVSVLAEMKPDWEEALEWVAGSYGIRNMRGQGNGRYLTLARESFLPAWMNTALSGIMDDENDEIFANAAAREFQKIALERWPDGVPTDPEELKEVWQEAINRARKVFILSGFSKSIFPGSIQRSYPWQEQVERYRALVDSVGQDRALDALIEELGEGAVFLTTPFSRADMPSTQAALDIYRDEELSPLAQRHPSMFWALYDEEANATEFDFRVYRWQNARGERDPNFPAFQLDRDAGQYTPGWVEASQVDTAWDEYTEAREYGQSLVDAGQMSVEDHQAAMRFIADQIAFEYPMWGVAREAMSVSSWRSDNDQAEMVQLHDALPNGDKKEAIGLYLDALHAAKSDLLALGLSGTNFDSQAAAPIREALHLATLSIVADYPTFKPFYNKILRFSLLPENDDIPPAIRKIQGVA